MVHSDITWCAIDIHAKVSCGRFFHPNLVHTAVSWWEKSLVAELCHTGQTIHAVSLLSLLPG